MRRSTFTDEQVSRVSDFLQNHMRTNGIEYMVPDDCAKLLAKHGVLPNDIGPKQGFNFRQMLRDGRDGLIDRVTGAEQSTPHKRWFIYRTEE